MTVKTLIFEKKELEKQSVFEKLKDVNRENATNIKVNIVMRPINNLTTSKRIMTK